MAKKDEKQREGVLTPRQQRYAIVTGILILVLLSIAAAFVYRVYLKTESSCYADLAVQTENAIDGLEANLRSDRTMLRVIAGLIGNAEDIDSIEVSGYLANYDINSMITQIGVLLPEDRVVLSKGQRSNFEGKLDF